MEIIKLIPSGKDYLWGGTRLKDEYGKKIDMTPLAVSWNALFIQMAHVTLPMVNIKEKH